MNIFKKIIQQLKAKRSPSHIGKKQLDRIFKAIKKEFGIMSPSQELNRVCKEAHERAYKEIDEEKNKYYR